MPRSSCAYAHSCLIKKYKVEHVPIVFVMALLSMHQGDEIFYNVTLVWVIENKSSEWQFRMASKDFTIYKASIYMSKDSRLIQNGYQVIYVTRISNYAWFGRIRLN